MSPRLQELQFFRLQQESKNIVSSTDHIEESAKKSKGEKRKSSSDNKDASNEESPAKRQKVKPRNKGSVKPNKVDDTVTPRDPTSHEENDMKTKDPTPEKFKEYTDQCTAFVSNLNLKASFLLSHL